MQSLDSMFLLTSTIVFVGVLTTFTDLRHKRIYNKHLIVGGIAGSLLVFIFNQSGHPNNIWIHLFNGLTGLLIGVILRHASIWRGGDAKLFALYSFLSPSTASQSITLEIPTNIFLYSFILCFIVLLPSTLLHIVRNRNFILRILLSSNTYVGFSGGIGAIFLFTWLFFPLFHLTKLSSPLIYLTLSCVIYQWGYSTEPVKKPAKLWVESILLFIAGLCMRLWLSPESLTYAALARYILKNLVFSLVAVWIHKLITQLKDAKDRIPFAPALFFGCMLSTTHISKWLKEIFLQYP